MTKVRKQKRKKRFNANINRKRLKKKMRKLPAIPCEPIKEEWEQHRSVATNLQSMGLSYDPNRAVGLPNSKQKYLEEAQKLMQTDETNSDEDNFASDDIEIAKKTHLKKKAHVAEALEKDAKAPRAKLFRLPNNEVNFITYMMDKYGDDYKAMTRDRKNYFQLTWKQIRAKIEVFKRIPEQYAEYLVKKGDIILEDSAPLKKIKTPTETVSIKKKRISALSRRRNRKKAILAIWEEKNMEPEILETNENESGTQKKLQLFPDNDDNDKIELISENFEKVQKPRKIYKNPYEEDKESMNLKSGRNRLR